MEKVDKWPERAAFRLRVEGFRDREGMTNESVAPLLGTTSGTLHAWLYGKGPRPRLESLVKAAEVLGCDLAEFYPTGELPAGLSGEAMEEATEEDRVYLRALASDLRRMNEAKKRVAIEAWTSLVRVLRRT